MTFPRTQWESDHLTRRPPSSFEEMEAAMRSCEQTQGQSVWDHGESVWDHLRQLLDHLRGLYRLPEGSWRLPDWLEVYRSELPACLCPDGQLRQYTLYHDCGKPYCRRLDKKTGQQHFPDHALVSSYVWACVGGNDNIGQLIASDMDVHTASAEDIQRKLEEGHWSREQAVSLLLAALAEIHSNAKLFGGTESTSFKMKWKTVDRRGRQICKLCLPNRQPTVSE